MARPAKSDLPQGVLDLLLLKIIALEPLHAALRLRDVTGERLRQISREAIQVTQGSLYPALHRLENRGLLDAEWKPSSTGRESKTYRLTRKGRAALDHESASWQRLIDTIGIVLNTSEGGAS